MQLTLQENELHEIIRNHVGHLITLNEGTTLDVSIKALRGTEGFTAVVDILNEGEAAPKAVVPRRGRKPKDEQKDPEPAKDEDKPQETGQTAQEQPVESGEGQGTTVTDQAGTAPVVNPEPEPAAQPDTDPATPAEDPAFDPEAEEAALKEQAATPKSNGTQNQDVGAKTATVASTTGTRPVFPGFKGLKRPGV